MDCALRFLLLLLGFGYILYFYVLVYVVFNIFVYNIDLGNA